MIQLSIDLPPIRPEIWISLVLLIVALNGLWVGGRRPERQIRG
ncbi:MAG TPA: hypothetical protein VMN57_12170 [Anaerolineales bacterium]|nr:hypothetical protein [Anaerolineales bacterium]